MTFIRGDNTRVGGNHAKYRKEAPDLEVASLRLGRYPFAAGIQYYSERKRGVWKEDTTMPERVKKLHQIGGILEDLKASGKISTTDPRHISERDIRTFSLAIKHLDPDSQGRLLHLLNGYLKFMKNRTLDDMVLSGEFTIPKAGRKPIRSIELEDLSAIFRTVEGMEGWIGSVCRGMVALYFGTGARPSELRMAEFRDLDLKKGRLFIRHPKGEGSWASAEWVDIIREDVLPMADQYVEERAEHLNGKKGPALFPNLLRKDGYYSENRFRVFGQRISEASGVDFSLKMFRSTLCTLTVNGDLSRLPATSIQLRHSSLATTQRYYADIDRSQAGRQLRGAWKETAIRSVAPEAASMPVVAIVQKHPLIDSRFEVTGYV